MLIIADDLTGAADCGVACLGCGLRTVVVLDEYRECDADVLSVDTNTRASGPEEAATSMARLIRGQARREDLLIYKKIDSTLRGNVAVEVRAALEARRAGAGGDKRVVAVLAPAFPAAGRTTIDGCVHVNGVPLAETDLWKNERKLSPANLLDMMSESGLRSALLGIAAIRGDDLQQRMQELACEADVLLCDAETEDDLGTIADASMTLGSGTIWVGSAGLAYHLPRAGRLQSESVPRPAPVVAGPILFVVGSGSSVSRRQARFLELWPDVVSVRVAPGVLRAGKELPEWRAHQAALERAFSAAVDVLVILGTEESSDSAQEPLLARALAEMLRPFGGIVGALLATGGDTATAILRAWGIAELQIVGEVEPGLPYSVAANWRRPLPILTKAGGFGKPETLLHCREFLRALGRAEGVQTR
ncbi:MAG TPA: four-carbon acid sugar kinase family protein [Terracidiphilus sp.]|nr:four-carbon acid sugar kinase family protein [Terracidiphilus sp.]